MPSTWFIVKSDRELGPYTSAQVKQLAASGQLKTEDLLRRANGTKPVIARKIQGLFPDVQIPDRPRSTPPPLPSERPLSGTTATVESPPVSQSPRVTPPPEQPPVQPPPSVYEIIVGVMGVIVCLVGLIRLGLLLTRPSDPAKPPAIQAPANQQDMAEVRRRLQEYHRPHPMDDDPGVKQIIDMMKRNGTWTETGEQNVKDQAEDFKKHGVW